MPKRPVVLLKNCASVVRSRPPIHLFLSLKLNRPGSLPMLCKDLIKGQCLCAVVQRLLKQETE